MVIESSTISIQPRAMLKIGMFLHVSTNPTIPSKFQQKEITRIGRSGWWFGTWIL